MEDRTINIIMITKRFGDVVSVREHIAKYMSEECKYPIDGYTEGILYGIVYNAFFDYLYSSSKERAVTCMRAFIDEYRSKSDMDRMISALSKIQVAEKMKDCYRIGNGDIYHYLDGWHDTKLTAKIEAGEWT